MCTVPLSKKSWRECATLLTISLGPCPATLRLETCNSKEVRLPVAKAHSNEQAIHRFRGTRRFRQSAFHKRPFEFRGQSQVLSFVKIEIRPFEPSLSGLHSRFGSRGTTSFLVEQLPGLFRTTFHIFRLQSLDEFASFAGMNHTRLRRFFAGINLIHVGEREVVVALGVEGES